MLTALLVRGATLPGAAEGIRFYLEPKWEKILDYQVIISVFRANATGSRIAGCCRLESSFVWYQVRRILLNHQSPPQHLWLSHVSLLATHCKFVLMMFVHWSYFIGLRNVTQHVQVTGSWSSCVLSCSTRDEMWLCLRPDINASVWST